MDMSVEKAEQELKENEECKSDTAIYIINYLCNGKSNCSININGETEYSWDITETYKV